MSIEVLTFLVTISFLMFFYGLGKYIELTNKLKNHLDVKEDFFEKTHKVLEGHQQSLDAAVLLDASYSKILSDYETRLSKLEADYVKLLEDDADLRKDLRNLRS